MLVKSDISYCFLPHVQTDGDSLRAFTTTFTWKLVKGTQLIAGSNSKNVKDWAIRSQGPTSAMQGYGQGSTTRWRWD